MKCLLFRTWFSLLLVASLAALPDVSDADPGRCPAFARGAAQARYALQGVASAGSDFDGIALMQRLIETSHPLRETAAPSAQRRRLDGLKAPAALHAVAIMVEFADSCFYGRQDLFDGLPTSTQSSIYYAAHDSLYYAHLLQDVADYYDSASGGRFALNVTVHGRVVELPDGMAHYGNHPEHGEQPFLLAADAIADLDLEIDFTQFDTVILIHAGAGQETDILRNSPEQIYSTYLGPDAFRWAVEDSIIALPYIPAAGFDEGDGVRRVLILPETQFQDPYEGFSGQFGSLGTYCFVVGLRLGMLSLSDFTPRGAPDSQGVGQFCLMGYGLFSAGGYIPPHPCAFNKKLMGWLQPYQVDPDLGETWTLFPSAFTAHEQAAARIDLTGSEYYLLEYRLQDPDGNNRFSFAGDLNGNNIPDFYDHRNPASGEPVDFFDPDTCVRERLTGAEWDFFLSDNPARAPGVKGAGSGIYIWHIDEGVIRDAFGLRQNLFNADPKRKSVDLVEADGIQDLDSREPSPYWLGGDDDSFRGEGTAAFGPDTVPATTTNGGVRAGLWIDQISNVVVDSAHVFHAGTDSQYTGILYAESMTFRCWREAPAEGAPRLLAARDLPGVDMQASHLLAAPLDGDAASGRPVFVAAADSGRVYAWTAELLEWLDHDDDPSTFEPLARGTDSGAQPVCWHMPATAGKFDPGRPGLQIVLSAPEGLYAFDQDGTPLAVGQGGTDQGLIAARPVVMPPVLLPLQEGGKLLDTVVACVVVGPFAIPGSPWYLEFLDHTGQDVCPPVSLPGRPSAPPVHADRILYVTLEMPDERGALAAISWPVPGRSEPLLLWQVLLDVIPGPHPPLVAPPLILVGAVDGSGQTIRLVEDIAEVMPPWAADVAVAGPMGPGGAFNGHDLLGRIAPSGVWQTGWPRRPLPAVRAGAAQPLGLEWRASGAGTEPILFHLFGARDGRLYLTDSTGSVQSGWPLAGPADLMATPAIVATTANDRDDPGLLLMVAGTTPQISGVGFDEQEHAAALEKRAVARLRSWVWPAEGPPLSVGDVGVMYGGSPWRGGAVPALEAMPPGMAKDLAASHVCYPQPLTTDVLKVRGHVARDATARATVFNLLGEKVRETGDAQVLGGAPFELEIDMRGVASGLYLCRLQADGLTSVKRIAVTR